MTHPHQAAASGAIMAMESLPIGKLCNVISAHIRDRIDAGITAAEAAQIMQLEQEIGRAVWPELGMPD